MDAGELKRAVGRRVQGLREGRGLTQEQLAEQIGRSVDTVANIERGANSTRIEVFARLADAFAVSLPELFELDPEPSAGRERRRQVRDLTRLLLAQDERTLSLLQDLLRTGLELKDG
jgi:transcriptional regulator with XRE-family HTH domain